MESEVKIENGKIVLSDEIAHEVSRWGNSLKAYLEGRNLIIAPEDGLNLLEPVADPSHPEIKYRRGASGWEPAIRGTGVTVRAVVELYRLYHDIDHIHHLIPHITRQQIESALSYHKDHPAELEYHIARNQESYQQRLHEKWELKKKNSSSPST